MKVSGKYHIRKTGKGRGKVRKNPVRLYHGWKKTRSSPSIKPNMEGWFIAWQKGRETIEIIRYYDEDRGKFGGFEVWNQTKAVGDDSWDGTHYATFNTVAKAVKYAEKLVREF